MASGRWFPFLVFGLAISCGNESDGSAAGDGGISRADPGGGYSWLTSGTAGERVQSCLEAHQVQAAALGCD